MEEETDTFQLVSVASNRHVFKNSRGFYENGSDSFARALVDVLRSLPTSWNTTMAFRSIPIISTSQAHNFFDMDPFLVRVLPIERYESPLSVGGALVSNRHVFKNLRGLYESGSEIFPKTEVGWG